MKKVNWRYF